MYLITGHRVVFRGACLLLCAFPAISTVHRAAAQERAPRIFHAQGEMAGEVGTDSVILQSRLTASEGLVDGDAPGAAGVARFEIADRKDFEGSRFTDWLEAAPESDFMVKAKVGGLQPGQRYFYRLVYGPDRENTKTGEVCSFRTLQGKDGAHEVSFVVVTVKARLAGFDRHLEEAAMDLYANEWTTFRRVTLPMILPGVFAAFMLGFALSFDDFIITNFNSGGTVTFPMFIWGAARVGVPAQVNVFGAAIFFITVSIMLLNIRLQRRRG